MSSLLQKLRDFRCWVRSLPDSYWHRGRKQYMCRGFGRSMSECAERLGLYWP